MNSSPELKSCPEYEHAEAERTRKLTAELVGLKTKPVQGWLEAVATCLAVVALQKLVQPLSLTAVDNLLILIGFVAPALVLGARLYKSEKRVNLLVQLLAENGTIKP